MWMGMLFRIYSVRRWIDCVEFEVAIGSHGCSSPKAIAAVLAVPGISTITEVSARKISGESRRTERRCFPNSARPRLQRETIIKFLFRRRIISC